MEILEELIENEYFILTQDYEKYNNLILNQKDIQNIRANIEDTIILYIRDGIYKYIDNNFDKSYIYKRKEQE